MWSPSGTIENQFPARFIQAIVRATEALLAAKTAREVDLRALAEVPAFGM
jgi:hypothetical protein